MPADWWGIYCTERFQVTIVLARTLIYQNIKNDELIANSNNILESNVTCSAIVDLHRDWSYRSQFIDDWHYFINLFFVFGYSVNKTAEARVVSWYKNCLLVHMTNLTNLNTLQVLYSTEPVKSRMHRNTSTLFGLLDKFAHVFSFVSPKNKALSGWSDSSTKTCLSKLVLLWWTVLIEKVIIVRKDRYDRTLFPCWRCRK